MTKVSIIDIDLGALDKIISENVAELHGEAQAVLDRAIEERKAIEKVKTQRAASKLQLENKLNEVMTKAYEVLQVAGEMGVAVEDVMNIVSPHVATPSAFTLRMKRILREDGNKYAMRRKMKDSVAHYIFESFNLQDGD